MPTLVTATEFTLSNISYKSRSLPLISTDSRFRLICAINSSIKRGRHATTASQETGWKKWKESEILAYRWRRFFVEACSPRKKSFVEARFVRAVRKQVLIRNGTAHPTKLREQRALSWLRGINLQKFVSLSSCCEGPVLRLITQRYSAYPTNNLS